MRQPSISLLVGLTLVGVAFLPAQAHKTELSGNVAGTWHLEPNHSAQAGEPTQVWVALTQQGGRVIALDQCDCKLAVYNENQASAPPVMQPTLKAMSPESFQNIPGAEITFPDLGEYRMVLTGSPKGDAAFSPFELSYTTVVAGSANSSPLPPQAVGNQSSLEQKLAPSDGEGLGGSQASPASQARFWVAIAVGGAGLAIAALWFLRHQKPPHHKHDGPE